MSLVDELKREREALLERIRAVDLLLGYNNNSSDVAKNEYVDVVTTTDEISDDVFPIKARKEKQILWLFENKLSHIVKISEVKELYQKYSGSDERVDNTARRMKREGKLALIKYNDNNILSYWALPSWIENNKLKDQYKLDPNLLPDIEKEEIFIN